MTKIGIFGGSFNPVHKDHLMIANGFLQQLNLDLVLLIPTFIAPHKQNAKAVNGIHRLNMLKIAVESSENKQKLIACDIELKKGGISYTVETLELLSKTYKDAQFYYLIGSDSLSQFHLWRMPEKILQYCNLVVAKRDKDDIQSITKDFVERFNYQPTVLNICGSNFSSSYARECLKLGVDISENLPYGVYDYIKRNDLYQGDSLYKFVSESSTENRLKHVAGVIVLAESYAKRLNVDTQKARLSALLHDVAKYMDYKDYPNFKLEKNVPPQVVHQFLGAYVAERILKIDDSEIINAIKWHTTGRANMTTLEKIIYTADLLEQTRTYDEVGRLRQAVDCDFESGFRLVVERSYAYLKNNDKEVYMTENVYDKHN